MDALASLGLHGRGFDSDGLHGLRGPSVSGVSRLAVLCAQPGYFHSNARTHLSVVQDEGDIGAEGGAAGQLIHTLVGGTQAETHTCTHTHTRGK